MYLLFKLQMELRCRVFSFIEDYMKRQQNWCAGFIEGLDSDVMKVGVALPKSSVLWKIVAGVGGCRF